MYAQSDVKGEDPLSVMRTPVEKLSSTKGGWRTEAFGIQGNFKGRAVA